MARDPGSAIATWEGGQIPGAGAKVLIKAGHAVTYDLRSDKIIRGITIAGTLAFAAGKDTELNVGLIRIEDRADSTVKLFRYGKRSRRAQIPASPNERHPIALE